MLIMPTLFMSAIQLAWLCFAMLCLWLVSRSVSDRKIESFTILKSIEHLTQGESCWRPRDWHHRADNRTTFSCRKTAMLVCYKNEIVFHTCCVGTILSYIYCISRSCRNSSVYHQYQQLSVVIDLEHHTLPHHSSRPSSCPFDDHFWARNSQGKLSAVTDLGHHTSPTPPIAFPLSAW